jgi:glycosyltransferase involved in cell wall biosynthesis
MCGEIDGETEVIRVSYPGDRPSVGDRVKAILAVARRRISEGRPDLIFVTASPFEDLSVARILSKEFGIPWVGDLRDPWALDEFQVAKSRWHRKFEIAEMCRVLGSASLIIMNTPEAAARLRNLLAVRSPTRITWITNGYDCEDFDEPLPRRVDKRFTIVHTGALHLEKGLKQTRKKLLYRIIGKVQPGTDLLPRSHVFLVKALERWIEEEPERKVDVRLVLAGVATKTDFDLVRRSSISSMVCFHGYLPHTESLQVLRSSDMLFLPLHQVGRTSRASIIPGKTYEYMAARKPILAAVPDGDAKDFLALAKCAIIVSPDDVSAMLVALKKIRTDWLNGLREPLSWDFQYIRCFERMQLTKRLAEELQMVLAQNRVKAESNNLKQHHCKL